MVRNNSLRAQTRTLAKFPSSQKVGYDLGLPMCRMWMCFIGFIRHKYSSSLKSEKAEILYFVAHGYGKYSRIIYMDGVKFPSKTHTMKIPNMVANCSDVSYCQL